MAETKMLTAKDLAQKAGISPAELRKLLRKEFDRAGKTNVEGKRMEYRFAANDPIVKEIIKRAKAQPEDKEKGKTTDQASEEPSAASQAEQSAETDQSQTENTESKE